MYEYVPKSEYAPVRKELEEIIKSVQDEMREEYGLTFQFRLIGSGKRHLVTRISGGNSSYDFDYNLVIQRWGTMPQTAKIVKQRFMDAFKNALRGTQYSFPKDSTSAITIKVVDEKQKKICYSCDFAIISYEKCNGNEGYYYLKNNKKSNSYEFIFRPLNYNIEDKVYEICAESNGWNYIREEYLYLKNINEGKEKHSFSLYIEAVNNAYNQIFNQ